MTDFTQDLLIRMRLDNQQAQAAARGFKNEIRAIGRESSATGRQIAVTKNEMAALGISSGRMRQAVGQAGFQVADLAIVLSSGQNALQAFAVQGGQLAGAFGPRGALVGALITVGGLLAAVGVKAFSSAGRMDTMADASKDLSAALGELEGALEASALSADEIFEKYGLVPEVFGSISSSIIEMKQLGVSDLLEGFIGSTTISDVIDDWEKFVQLQGMSREEVLEKGPSVVKVYDDYVTAFGEMDEGLKKVIESIVAYNNAAKNGSAASQVRATADLHEALKDLGGNEESIVALRAALADLVLDLGSVERDTPTWVKSLEALQESITNIGSAAELGGDKLLEWAGEIFTAMKTAAEAHHAYEEAVGRGRGGDPRDFEDDPYWTGRYFPTNQNLGPPKEDKGSKKVSEEVKELKRLQEEIEQQVEDFENTITDSYGDFLSAGIDGFIDTLFDAEASFKDFARSILEEMSKMIIRQLILNALMSAFGGVPGNPTNIFQQAIQGAAGITTQLPGSGGGSMVKFAKGGILNEPTYLAYGGGSNMALAGEAGAEAIMPVHRRSDGNLGVAGPSIEINNYTGQEVSVDRNEDLISIAVGRARSAIENDFSRSMSTGQGTYARGIERGYNSRRKL